MPPERLTWKTGYWQDPTWQKGPINPGEENELMRKHRAQLALWRGQALPKKRKLNFEELCERDEKRLAKAREQSQRKRDAVSQRNQISDSEDSL